MARPTRPVTFRMRRRAIHDAGPLLLPFASLQRFSGSAFCHVPADIHSGGPDSAHRPPEQTQRIEAQVKWCGDVLSAVNGQIQFFRAKFFTMDQLAAGASDFGR
jgi:hypothetical protein